MSKITIPPYIRLRECDLPFWEGILASRETWTEIQLTQAANLARCHADIEEVYGALQREGGVVKNHRGTPVQNPRHHTLETLNRMSISLSKKLES